MDLDDEIETNYEEALKNFVTNENSIYPKIEGCKNGDTRLEDIFNFLKFEIYFNNHKLNKKLWPKFITVLEDQIKENKENKIFRYNKEKNKKINWTKLKRYSL